MAEQQDDAGSGGGQPIRLASVMRMALGIVDKLYTRAKLADPAASSRWAQWRMCTALL